MVVLHGWFMFYQVAHTGFLVGCFGFNGPLMLVGWLVVLA